MRRMSTVRNDIRRKRNKTSTLDDVSEQNKCLKKKKWQENQFTCNPKLEVAFDCISRSDNANEMDKKKKVATTTHIAKTFRHNATTLTAFVRQFYRWCSM